MSETTSYKLWYSAEEKFLKDSGLTLDNKGGYEAHTLLRDLGLWLHKKQYGLYDANKSGLFKLDSECAGLKSTQDDPEKAHLKSMLEALAQTAINARYLEDITDGPELQRIMDWYQTEKGQLIPEQQ